ncbi:AMIN-like domain-containing (lipo)protein [Nocardioides pantholopis]|uniref:AMIN-like domain-containing (lipo)protein n=1 Tax=Nocardioides pantholopis TaxID=2483798 RepID=UPI0013DE75C3|nr:hypothetical protein [Nocardioides pantholopis]
MSRLEIETGDATRARNVGVRAAPGRARSGSSALLASGVLVLALTTSCGGHSGDETGAGNSPGPSATQEPLPSRSPSPSSTTPGAADQQTHKRSGPYDLVLEAASVVEHEGHDRIVLRFAGAGSPGWAARFVDEAVQDGSGEVVELDGDAVLQLDISGTPTRRNGPVRKELGGGVADLHTAGVFEGMTQVFIGLRGGRTPFRVSALSSPSRLVVDLG